jgi:hypothetical protein
LGRGNLRHPKFNPPSVGINAGKVVVAEVKAAERAYLNVDVRTNAFAGSSCTSRRTLFPSI